MDGAPRNLVLRANAGTGKTFTLATRFIRLMLFDGCDPSRIIALTFARAAAHEIFQKILERLWNAASSAEGAAKERDALLDGLSPETAAALEARHPFAPQTFLRLLRKTVDSQHFGNISTIDSFIFRLVASFPLEMGFQGEIELLEEYLETEEVEGAIAKLLRSRRFDRTFRDAYLELAGGKFKRIPASVVGGAVEKWRAVLLDHPEAGLLDAEKILSALRLEPCGKPSLEWMTEGRKKSDIVCKMAAKASSPLQEGKPILDGTQGSLALRALAADPLSRHLTFDWKDDAVCVELSDAEAQDLLAALKAKIYARYKERAMKAAGQIAVAKAVEEVYSKNARRAGRLTFSDFTVAGSETGVDIENVEYRFDSRFDHWALDEFQDTSVRQWMCMRELVRSAAAERSVMVVGDLKQSIYTWRGGNDAPFKEVMSWPEFHGGSGACESLSLSFRYGKNIAAFVEKVFGKDNLEFAIPAERRKALDKWLAEDCWMEHKTACGAADHVKVVFSKEPEQDCADGASGDIAGDTDGGVPQVYKDLADELEMTWTLHERAGSAETVGVLVRNNVQGRKIADYLRKRGIPAVWEGVSPVDDCPAAAAIVELVNLAAHPGDVFSWRTVDTLYPVRKAVFPHASTIREVSGLVASDLVKYGLARTVREYAKRLSAYRTYSDPMSADKLSSLIRAAARYEETNPNPGDTDGWRRYLDSAKGRETAASSRTVRVMTIHRSKGLTFDRTFVPVMESKVSRMDAPSSDSAIMPADGEILWALPLSAADAALNAETAKAYGSRQDECVLSELRTYYVALTRSRKSLFVFAPADPVSSGVTFADVLAGREGRVSRETGVPPPFAQGVREEKKMCARQAFRLVREGSAAATCGIPAGGARRFVSLSESSRKAAESGTEFHAALAAIEWADGEELEKLPRSFRRAFAKPSADAAVWRERGYEILDSGRWESGRFDRVVFEGEGDSRKATIYDFKTDAMRRGESAEAFRARMERVHSRQMQAYSRALSVLSGIPPKSISAVLLLESADMELELWR